MAEDRVEFICFSGDQEHWRYPGGLRRKTAEGLLKQLEGGRGGCREQHRIEERKPDGDLPGT